MSDYTISTIYASDTRSRKQIDTLLNEEGIRRDKNLDYTCAMFDENMQIIATGSCFGNTLRCMAVSSAHQGEGLMNEIVTHLITVQFERGNTHLFLYTKCSSARFFGSLGFYEIARIDEQIVFMENRRTGFKDYLTALQKSVPEEKTSELSSKKDGRIAALVMNANPFTLGHQYLVEKASRENDIVHLFIVSEDTSLIPFAVRKKLVKEGIAHLDNIILHDSGPYIISNATFPSYFQKDETAVMESHAMLDLTIFTRIADVLHITRRYVGEEPYSVVTGIYNKIMKDKLPETGIDCIVIPRKEIVDTPISASTVRTAIKTDNIALLKTLVPETTFRYFQSPEALSVIEKIKQAENVIHH